MILPFCQLRQCLFWEVGHSPVRPVHYSSSLWNFLRKKKAGTFWNKYKQNQVTTDQLDLNTLSYVYIIIINWYYNLFQVRLRREGGLFLFYFWIYLFSTILSVALEITGSIIHQCSHPLLLFFPFHAPTGHPTNDLEKTSEPGNEHSGQTGTQSFPIN